MCISSTDFFVFTYKRIFIKNLKEILEIFILKKFTVYKFLKENFQDFYIENVFMGKNYQGFYIQKYFKGNDYLYLVNFCSLYFFIINSKRFICFI